MYKAGVYGQKKHVFGGNQVTQEDLVIEWTSHVQSGTNLASGLFRYGKDHFSWLLNNMFWERRRRC
jgi:hypothetical protein